MDKGDRSAATSLVRNTLSALCVRSRAEPFPHLHQLQLAVQRASRTGCSTRILYREVEGVFQASRPPPCGERGGTKQWG